MVNVEEIAFRDNKIKFLRENLFSKNLKLKKLYMYDNKFEPLSPKMFSHLTNLNTLRIFGNFQCVDKVWNSQAFQKINEIEESLIPCGYKYYSMDVPKFVEIVLKEFAKINKRDESSTGKIEVLVKTVQELQTQNINLESLIKSMKNSDEDNHEIVARAAIFGENESSPIEI